MLNQPDGVSAVSTKRFASSTQFNSMDIVNDEELGTDHVIDFVSMSGEVSFFKAII